MAHEGFGSPSPQQLGNRRKFIGQPIKVLFHKAMARQREVQALHSTAPVPAGPVDRKSSKTEHFEHLFRKTKLCAFFQRGQCNKGRECGFAHGEQDLSVRPNLTKTVMCSAWLRRRSCRAGKACTFAHGAAELRREPPTDARDCSEEGSQTTRSGSDDGSDFSGNVEEVQYRSGEGSQTTRSDTDEGSDCSGNMEEVQVLQHLYELSNAEAKLVEVALAGSDGVQKRASCKILEQKLLLAAPDFYED